MADNRSCSYSSFATVRAGIIMNILLAHAYTHHCSFASMFSVFLLLCTSVSQVVPEWWSRLHKCCTLIKSQSISIHALRVQSRCHLTALLDTLANSMSQSHGEETVHGLPISPWRIYGVCTCSQSWDCVAGVYKRPTLQSTGHKTSFSTCFCCSVKVVGNTISNLTLKLP